MCSSEKHSCLLLIDDDDDMIAIGEQVFVKAGYQFISAGTGGQGLEAMLHYKPDIVIIDYLLPDMKGEDVIKQVADDEKYRDLRHTPFLILTAWEESLQEIDKLYACGLKAYLTKPFGHRELRCVVDNVIALSRVERDMTGLSQETGNLVVLDEQAVDLVQSILGLSKQLLESTQGELDERQSQDLNAIHNCSIKLMRRIEAESDKNAQQGSQTRTMKYDG